MTTEPQCRAALYVNVEGSEVTRAFQCHRTLDHTGDHKASGNLAGFQVWFNWPQK